MFSLVEHALDSKPAFISTNNIFVEYFAVSFTWLPQELWDAE